MRFNSSVSDGFIETYCRGLPGASPIILGYYAGDTLRGAAELFILADNSDRRSCEIALSVEADHQGRGIGTSLVRRMLVLASNRRVRTMHVLYTRGNKRMENIVRRFDAAVSSDGAQAEAVLRVPLPDDLSVFEEAMIGGARRGRVRVALPGADCPEAARAQVQGPHPRW